VRWLPVLSGGGRHGLRRGVADGASPCDGPSPVLSSVRQTVFYAVMTALLELPSTLCFTLPGSSRRLYAASSGLRRHLRVAALTVPAVVLASLGAFAATRGYRNAHAGAGRARPVRRVRRAGSGHRGVGSVTGAYARGIVVRRRVARPGGRGSREDGLSGTTRPDQSARGAKVPGQPDTTPATAY
jgi:hypothetical protein